MSRVFVRPGSWWSALRATWRMFAALTQLLPRVDLAHIPGYTAKNILVTAMAKLFSRPIVLHLQTARHDEPLRPVVRLWGVANPFVQGVGGLLMSSIVLAARVPQARLSRALVAGHQQLAKAIVTESRLNTRNSIPRVHRPSL